MQRQAPGKEETKNKYTRQLQKISGKEKPPPFLTGALGGTNFTDNYKCSLTFFFLLLDCALVEEVLNELDVLHLLSFVS